MIEIDWRRLEERQQAQWQAALEETPLLEERGLTAPLPVLAALSALAILVCYLNRPRPAFALWTHAVNLDLTRPAIVWAVGACVLALSAAAARWTIRVGGCRMRVGRFLHRWGYAEVTPGRIRFVPGSDIAYAVSIGPASLSGASTITIRLSATRWTSMFRLRGSELDVPRAGLEALASTRPRFTEAGYRESASAPTRSNARRTIPPWVRHVSLGAGASLLGAVMALGLCMLDAMADAQARARIRDLDRWTALERAAPLPWFIDGARAARARERDADRARIVREVAEPYRAELLLLQDSGWPSVEDAGHCRVSVPDAIRIDAYVRSHAPDGQAVLPLHAPALSVGPRLGPYFLPQAYAATGATFRQARFELQCAWEPVGLTGGASARAAVRLHAEWSYSVDGRIPIRRTLDVERSDIGAVLDECRDDGGYDELFSAALAIVHRAVTIDVSTPAVRTQWDWSSRRGRDCVMDAATRVLERRTADAGI